VEQLIAKSKSARKHAGITTAEVSSRHLLLAVSAARLAAAADRLARHYVELAREAEGATWEQVGEAFGTTRQSAHERFRPGLGGQPSCPRRAVVAKSRAE
jgi:hypothetical protein